MNDIIRVTETVLDVVTEFMPHVPKMNISKSLMTFTIFKDLFVDSDTSEFKKLMNDKIEKLSSDEYDSYEYNVFETDAFVIVVVCLI